MLTQRPAARQRREALGDRFVPAMMVLLLFSMSFAAATNVLGALFILGSALLARLRGSV